MSLKKHEIAMGLSAVILAAPAEANLILPASIPLSLVLGFLLPVIVIEAFVLGGKLGISIWIAVKAALFANSVSTLAGIPLAAIWLNTRHRLPESWVKFTAWIFLVLICWLGSCFIELKVVNYYLGDRPDIRSAIILANSFSYLFLIFMRGFYVRLVLLPLYRLVFK